jgi:hypothetical protein
MPGEPAAALLLLAIVMLMFGAPGVGLIIFSAIGVFIAVGLLITTIGNRTHASRSPALLQMKDPISCRINWIAVAIILFAALMTPVWLGWI